MRYSCKRLLAAAVILIAAPLSADQVTLKNGDRLSGSILKYDGKNLVLKSELAGDVTIPWDAVTGVTSSSALNVGLQDGQLVVGTVKGADGKLQIETEKTGTVATTKDSVQFIRSKEEQALYDLEIDRYRNPRLIDLWVGSLDFGYSTAQGNANTNNLAIGAKANRITSRDKIGVYYTSIYANTDSTGADATTANARRGGISYSLNVTPKWYVFGSVDLEFDEFQSLDLRFVPAGGMGYHAFKRETSFLDLFAGAALNREFFSTGLNRSSGELLFGDELAYQLNKITMLTQKLTFYPNVSDAGSFRINFDAGAVTNLNRWLAWSVTVSDRYLSNPVQNRKKNDILFTTGLRLSFVK